MLTTKDAIVTSLARKNSKRSGQTNQRKSKFILGLCELERHFKVRFADGGIPVKNLQKKRTMRREALKEVKNPRRNLKKKSREREP